MSIWKILLLIFGVILVVGGLAMAFGGGAALWANSALIDDEGYLTTDKIEIEKVSHAIVSKPTDIEVGSWAVWDWGELAKFKIEGSNNDTSQHIFMGVAGESDLATYLNDVDYDEVIDIEINPDRLEYRNYPGGSEPSAPIIQSFWWESVNGPGTQTLKWELQPGAWSLVLMNEDGSIGIDASIILGVKIPWLFGVGVGFLSGGILVFLLGVCLIVISVLRPSRS